MLFLPLVPAAAVAAAGGFSLCCVCFAAVWRCSMTESELDGAFDGGWSDSRMERVARGSGSSLQEVNALLAVHKQFEKMVGKMGKTGLLKGGDAGFSSKVSVCGRCQCKAPNYRSTNHGILPLVRLPCSLWSPSFSFFSSLWHRGFLRCRATPRRSCSNWRAPWTSACCNPWAVPATL